jgi:LysM domain-containing protein
VSNDPAAGDLPRGLIRPDDRAVPGPDTAARATPHADRVSDPQVCPFLRVIEDGERVGPPIEAPDPANRCAALREPVPQSLRQQELVCLSSGHVNCPRYLRGSLDVAPTRPVRTPRAAPSIHITPATAGALAIFTAAFLLSVGFVLANGGVVLTAVASTPALSGGVLGAIETAPPTPAPTPVPTLEPTPSPTPTVVPTDTPEPTTTPLPSATLEPSAPPPTVVPTAKPASGRYALLTACADRSGCWIYHIRSGDNLYSIANYFGVSIKTVQAWNPWTQSGLKVGRELRIPTPTR